MRTEGDVRAELDKALSDLDKLRLVDLPPLIARVEKITEGHPDVLRLAVERIRKHLPPSLVQQDIRWVGGLWLERFLSGAEQSSPMLPWRTRPRETPIVERTFEDVSPCELGFTADIPAGKSEIKARPQMCFRGQLLVISDEKCTDGDLIEIRVGSWPQAVAGPGRRPLSLYCPAKWADEELMKKATLHMDTATPELTISLVVDVRRPMRFQAVIRGIGARAR